MIGLWGKEKKADFPRVTAFGKTAELCKKLTEKGKMIVAQGRLQTESYKSKEGATICATDVVADRVEFLE